MNAPLSPPLLEIADAPPPPGEAREVAPGVLWLRMPLPFALDHINLWLARRKATATRSSTAATATRRRARIGSGISRRRSRRARFARIVATHCHPDHLGNAAWLAARFDCTVAMTQGEYLAAHALIDEQRGLRPGRRARALRARTAWRPSIVAALAARGNHYQRGVPEAPHAFARLIDGDTLALGARQWRVIAGYGHSPEHASLATREGAAADRRRHAAAADQHERRRVAGRARRRSGRALPRFARALRDAAAATRWCCLRTACRFAASRARVAQLARASRRAPRRAACARCVDAGAPQSAQDVIPVLFRRELDLQQRFFAMGEAIAHLNHLWRAGRVDAPRRRPTGRSASPRKMAALPSAYPQKPMSAPAVHCNAADAAARRRLRSRRARRIARRRRREERQADGRLRSRNAGKQAAVATDELGLGKAFMELAAKMLANPGAARRRRR